MVEASSSRAGIAGSIPGRGAKMPTVLEGKTPKHRTEARISLVAQSVVKNPSANAGDTGSIPGLGRFPHAAEQLSCAQEPHLPSTCAATTEACMPQSPCSTAREAAAMRSPHTAAREKA